MDSQTQQAREAFGTRLREIRQDAELTARALAALAGWHFTKVSKLEHGARMPTAEDIRAWCRCCHADRQASDLIATVRSIDAMYADWRRRMRAGLQHFQDTRRPLYERTRVFRVYENTFIPGLLNTAGYAAAVLGFWADLMGLPADTSAAVAARMDRQHILYGGDRKFMFILEQQTLLTRVG
ncbi:MAG: Scr1 family TA system antitoxin-like transcriptional regulator, partial [Streptosporangiaceae bacterium]